MNIGLSIFEKHIYIGEPLIKLGKKYYDNGHVINLTQSSSNEWHANIKAIEEYSVNVELRYSEIVKSTCTCSFDGLHCIHKIAAYYAIYNAEFPNKLSEISVSESTLSELEDDIIVQDACWAIHKEYLKFNKSGSNSDITKIFREIRKSLTKAKNTAKEKKPFLAVRLLSVSYYELMEFKGYIMSFRRDDHKLDERWYGLYELTKNKTSVVIAEIQNEKIAKCVTELLLNEILELWRPEDFLKYYSELIEEYRELYFKILIEISPLAQSYEQIQQLLNEPGLLSPKEKKRFMNELLLKQGINV